MPRFLSVCLTVCASVQCHWTKIQDQEVILFQNQEVRLLEILLSDTVIDGSCKFLQVYIYHVYESWVYETLQACGLTSTSSCIFVMYVRIFSQCSTRGVSYMITVDHIFSRSVTSIIKCVPVAPFKMNCASLSRENILLKKWFKKDNGWSLKSPPPPFRIWETRIGIHWWKIACIYREIWIFSDGSDTLT